MNVNQGSTPVKDKFIIFLHIQKTGGITIQRVMRRKLGKSIVKRLTGLLTSEPEYSSVVEMLRHKTRSDNYVIGHFCYGIDQHLPKPSVYMAFLREPVSRIISLYEYSKQNPTAYYHQHALNKTLEEFALDTPLMELDNGQVRFIAGDVEDCFINRTPIGKCTEELLQQAIHNIDTHFALIGLTESFDQSLLLLQQLMDWKSCFYLRRNIGKGKTKMSISQELKDRIREKNHLDMLLYDYAKKHLESQLKERGLDQPEVLQSFQQKNALFNQTFGRAYSVYDFTKALIKGELGRPS